MPEAKGPELPDDHTVPEAGEPNAGEAQATGAPSDQGQDAAPEPPQFAGAESLPADTSTQTISIRPGRRASELALLRTRPPDGQMTVERLRARHTHVIKLATDERLMILTLGGRDAAYFQGLEQRAGEAAKE